jgi:large subunit ribosomal protein L25
MEMIEITVEHRAARGKGNARRLRRGGLVPAIFYGPKRNTVAIGVQAEEFEKKLTHLEGAHLIRLLNTSDADLNDKAVLLREVQRHPVTGDILHADFLEVDLTERLTVSVPLRFVGKAEGVVAGGILQPILREIEVECLPTEIPDFIEVDVSALGIHEAIHLSDLTLPEGVTAISDAGQTLVTVVPPTVEEAKPAAEAAEAAPVEGAPAEAAPGAAPAEAPPAEAKGRKGGGEG